MTIFFKFKWYGQENPNAVFTNTSPIVLWCFLLLYGTTTITFCFMISVFFSKANIAAAVGGLAWIIFYTPYFVIHTRYSEISRLMKMIFCLLHNTSMALGFKLIVKYEGISEGLQWSNVFTPISIDDDFHVGYVFIMLTIDAILYLIIALYVEKIFPGDFGVAEKWNFIFTKQFWRRDRSEVRIKNEKFGINIVNLRKVYDDDKVAVKGLNLDLMKDEITALLGEWE
jgi:ATP-binding cassette, subfamily A (ABC1), member 3